MLAIAGRKLGFDPVTALDHDPVTLEAAATNARENGVTLELRLAEALEDPLPPADVAVANISATAIETVAERVERRTARHLGIPRHRASTNSSATGTSSGGSSMAGRPTCGAAPSRVPLPVASFSVRFLGCKVSYSDAQEIRERLLDDGHEEAADGADIAVVNACCVTHEAVRKSRHAASRARRAPTHASSSPAAAPISTPTDSPACRTNVTVVRGRSEATPDLVAQAVGPIGCVQADARIDRVRAFVKVQDGCSFSCSFCVVPLVRGESRSRPAAAVLDEIRRRVAQGHREIVLTGINLGCYRDRAAGYTLARLIREAGSVPGVARLRLSSIEVNHVGPELIAAMRETATVSRHLHVPLQSGDDAVLQAMSRRYTSDTFLRRVGARGGLQSDERRHRRLPGEDEAAFERTLGVVERAGITKVHVFPYSPRPGTRTAAADTVPPELKKERSARLREASRAACLAHWREKLGREDVVLVDRPGRGYGDDYSPWLVEGEPGELVRARARAVTEEGILAA